MTTVNVTNFRQDMFNYLEQVIKYNEPISIASKKGNVVLLNEDEYRGILDTLYISDFPKLKEDIKHGMKKPVNEHVEIDWRKELCE
jgi:PHD/YefM family antitoxin component YafN of YafNO toxin-antitoxin module